MLNVAFGTRSIGLDLNNRLVCCFQVDLQFDFAIFVDETAVRFLQRGRLNEISEAGRHQFAERVLEILFHGAQFVLVHQFELRSDLKGIALHNWLQKNLQVVHELLRFYLHLDRPLNAVEQKWWTVEKRERAGERKISA